MAIAKNKLYGALTSLAALAALAPVTGNNEWLAFLSFLSFYSFIKVKMDERMKSNIDRAARNGYIAALLCMTGMLIYITTHPATEQMVTAFEITFVITAIVTSVSFTAYDRFGK